ncbi:endonuclease VII domain-containing protein, partial [Candidatus Pacearchaeota archaeon]|nr:endonuclease VII domain-containing protein [Candidatus Pacearchaeota archaeon]
MKTCTKCGETKEESQFSLTSYAACIATVEEIKSAFTGKCFVCGIPETECNQRLHLDHCHKTG